MSKGEEIKISRNNQRVRICRRPQNYPAFFIDTLQ